LTKDQIPKEALPFYKAAHISYKKELRNQEKKIAESLLPDDGLSELFSDFLGELAVVKSDNPHISAPDYLFTSKTCPDHQDIMLLKQTIHNESNPLLNAMLQSGTAQMAYRYHLFATQLIHIGNFANRKNTFYIINTGITNIQCIAAGTNHKPSSDPGVPFFFIGKVPQKHKMSKVFGHITEFPLNDTEKIFITNWRRLKMEKLTHLRDVFFSSLSTGFKNLITIEKPIAQDFIEYYVFRTIAGLSAAQKVAEFLADFKYIAMSSISEFSRTTSLILEKIKPPFTRHIEIFILIRLIEKSYELISSMSRKSVKIHEFQESNDANQFAELMVGGELELPYIWASTGSHKNFNNFLDSVHTYVHTIKEPASYYHETVKSLKTIFKFDSLYDKMSANERIGLHDDKSMKKLLKENKIGFSAKFLKDATNHFLKNNHIPFTSLIMEQTFF
jgi:hypothetical protein